ncbi:MAG: hypothetical protein RR123_01240 [Clostridia bacterium]
MKRFFGIISIVALIMLSCFGLIGCGEDSNLTGDAGGNLDVNTPGNESYHKVYDLSEKKYLKPNYTADGNYLFENIEVDRSNEVADDGRSSYLGHPDSVLLDDQSIFTVYPKGHGRGQTIYRKSYDYGKTYTDRYEGNPISMPENWKDAQETPTIYKLDFINGAQKLIIISGRPGWSTNPYKGEGFDVSLSQDNGKNWTPYVNFYGPKAPEKQYQAPAGQYNCIVAMASLTQLKDANGNFTNSWMGLFHDYSFSVYKTILTFDANDKMNWSLPEKISTTYSDLAAKNQFCEVEAVRSPVIDRSSTDPTKNGNQICLIFRANAKISSSYTCFTNDEGKTWSAPKETSITLAGERHKAEYDPISGRLLITYRADNWKGVIKSKINWYSQGWFAWVGTYDDLVNSKPGDYLIKLAHTYLDGQSAPQIEADGDTGYAGNVVFKDGLFVLTSYGRFEPIKENTFVVTKRLRLADIEKFVTPRILTK